MEDHTPSLAPKASAELLTVKDMLRALREAFPVFADNKPLAIGIDKQAMAIRPDFDKKLLKPAIGLHTRSISYLKALQNATHRFNIDGTSADPVTPAQQELAAQQLRERFKLGAEKRRAEKAAAEAVEAEQERMRKLATLAEKFGRK
ncbi:ProQ/FINO family protein [Zoogloea sp. LCSB751]|uniref:ProQ/FINO family protein n=1 Tax=Zoogloea sp. LCSB751 TaxID=1965277 RepID=UPI0009A53D5C|nr:ProQ/FinO family protein [Zoogloea sp. LCSB751]